MVGNATVLVIEDDENLRELLVFHLQHAGFDVLEAGAAAFAWEHVAHADVVILDWMLPDISGVEWLQQLRLHERYHSKAVLMLTARASEQDKVEGLSVGADDYLIKPFSNAELVARLRALLRRTHAQALRVVGHLKVDDVQGIATLEQEILQLTRREFELLSFLTKHPKRIFSRSELLDHVWGEDFLGTERTVDQHIAQLRAMIGNDYIQTVRGRGYRLLDPQVPV